MKISILIPVYNEENTISKLLSMVDNKPLELDKEIIAVDDCSTDGTYQILDEEKKQHDNLKVFRHDKNLGKGAAIRTAINHATGDIILIQDADLEYSPDDYDILLRPILQQNADVVYGSRFIGGNGVHRVHHFKHYLGNKIITFFCNLFSDLNLTDVEVCYKVFRKEVLKDIKLKENRFGFEIEITLKIARKKCRIYEVPISYFGRDYSEGKKITWKDGVVALWCIFKYGLFTGK